MCVSVSVCLPQRQRGQQSNVSQLSDVPSGQAGVSIREQLTLEELMNTSSLIFKHERRTHLSSGDLHTSPTWRRREQHHQLGDLIWCHARIDFYVKPLYLSESSPYQGVSSPPSLPHHTAVLPASATALPLRGHVGQALRKACLATCSANTHDTRCVALIHMIHGV